MAGNKGRDRSWHFFWHVPDVATLRELETFVRLSVVRGVHHTAILTELVVKYNREFLELHSDVLSGVTLADEKFLMARLRPRTPVSRVLLSRYRASGRLVPKNGGKPLYWTDGRRVVYNLEGCKAFFMDRRAA